MLCYVKFWVSPLMLVVEMEKDKVLDARHVIEEAMSKF